jgi:hypothetical protein
LPGTPIIPGLTPAASSSTMLSMACCLTGGAVDAFLRGAGKAVAAVTQPGRAQAKRHKGPGPVLSPARRAILPAVAQPLRKAFPAEPVATGHHGVGHRQQLLQQGGLMAVTHAAGTHRASHACAATASAAATHLADGAHHLLLQLLGEAGGAGRGLRSTL